MRDFDWFDELYAVVKDDGSFAGRPCISLEEARELQVQHEGSKIFELKYDNSNFEDLARRMVLQKLMNLGALPIISLKPTPKGGFWPGHKNFSKTY